MQYSQFLSVLMREILREKISLQVSTTALWIWESDGSGFLRIASYLSNTIFSHFIPKRGLKIMEKELRTTQTSGPPE